MLQGGEGMEFAPRFDSIPAASLRNIQSIVGETNQVARTAAFRGASGCNPEASGNNTERACLMGNIQIPNCGGNQIRGRVRQVSGRCGQENDEFLSSISGYIIFGSRIASNQGHADRAKAIVAGLVAVSIVV